MANQGNQCDDKYNEESSKHQTGYELPGIYPRNLGKGIIVTGRKYAENFPAVTVTRE
jgi:hypothetical protein